jgi:hypothetical protein
MKQSGAQEVVYEQLLTILFAVGVGAAIIVYAARPRSRSVTASIAHGSAVGSFRQAAVVRAAPVPQVTAIQVPVVETSIASDPQSVVEVAPAVAEIAAAVPSEAAPVSSAPGIDVSAVASTPVVEGAGTTSHSPTRSHKATKRKSTTRSRAKPSQRTKKS